MLWRLLYEPKQQRASPEELVAVLENALGMEFTVTLEKFSRPEPNQ